jgi:DNA-binding transcriptional MerR regulator
MNSNEQFSIGELSKALGVKIVTIRYYEHVKLIPTPPRTARNFRVYRQEHLHHLKFIRRRRALGFTHGQLRDLLRFSAQAHRECASIDRIAGDHLRDIECKIADLRRLAAQLRRINIGCPGKGRIADCCILAALSPTEEKSPRGDTGKTHLIVGSHRSSRLKALRA